MRRLLAVLLLAILVLWIIGVEVKFPGTSNAKDYWTELSDSERKSGAGIDVGLLNQTFISLAEKLSPTVVNVYTKTRITVRPEEQLFQYFFGNPFEGPGAVPREAQSLGSGFVINKDGHIITNSHVVRYGDRTADEVMVKFIGDQYGRGFEATVVGVDPSTDVALLKLKEEKKDLRIAAMGNSDHSKVGEWVLAIGNPYGHGHSVTQGIVSAVGRSLEEIRAEFIQTSASINPGNSGGPLFNLYGEVIGINTAIDARAQGIGFAIPINTAKSVVKQLIEKGKVARGWLGISIGTVTPEISDALKQSNIRGAIIGEVYPGGPAQASGLKPYDIITKINGKTIDSANALAIAIGDLEPGKVAELEVWRQGERMAVKVTPTNMPEDY
jgi:serine protease Do